MEEDINQAQLEEILSRLKSIEDKFSTLLENTR
jgi:hypothetical protein